MLKRELCDFSILSCTDYQGLTAVSDQKVTMQKKKLDFGDQVLLGVLFPINIYSFYYTVSVHFYLIFNMHNLLIYQNNGLCPDQ